MQEEIIGKRVNENNGFTILKCQGCGGDVKVDFLYFLLNLDKEILCEDCKDKEGVK